MFDVRPVNCGSCQLIVNRVIKDNLNCPELLTAHGGRYSFDNVVIHGLEKVHYTDIFNPIDIAFLPKGVYLLKVNFTDKSTCDFKIIKQ